MRARTNILKLFVPAKTFSQKKGGLFISLVFYLSAHDGGEDLHVLALFLGAGEDIPVQHDEVG